MIFPRKTLGAWIALIGACALPDGAVADPFSFTNINERSLALYEGARPVYIYNHGVIQPPPGMAADRARSSYIHPLYGLDGEVLTDDFPADHPHHRGLFWSWPHVRIDGRHYDLWMLKGIKHQFVRWLARDAGPTNAILALENRWVVDQRPVMREEIRIEVGSATREARWLDLAFTWTPLGRSITLEGAEGKSYGGLTLRFAPRTTTVITTPLGQGNQDLSMTRLPWADLSARFEQRPELSGAAIFVARNHPNYPPEWLTRHYGVLCLGWPGVQPQTFPANQPVRCHYRVWIHRGAPSVQQADHAYRLYQP